MKQWLERQLARIWNRSWSRRGVPHSSDALDLGTKCSEDGTSRGAVRLPHDRRSQHIAILGKTGQGKSSLIRRLTTQDVAANRGFASFDLHGDASRFQIATVAAREKGTGEDLSAKLIVIDPSDAESSVGLNPLEAQVGIDRFVQISECAQILRQHWRLDSFGARTDELLRNSLWVLSENELTLVELSPLLTDSAFRSHCLQRVTNVEVKQYFSLRYDQASEPMRAVMREPILNKTSAFTANPHFRHIVGQRRSTFSVTEAMDHGCWIVVNLHKGKLGEQVVTLGSLLLTTIKNALFSRRRRDLFTLYCDEIQNLVAFGGGLETILSEARKFGISVVSANQFLDQYPQEMRSAILAVGTHIFFCLSSVDAQHIATALDGGKPLAERLKNLPRRHMVVKSGSEPWQEARVPTVAEPSVDTADLEARCRMRWARKRTEIEADICKRLVVATSAKKKAAHDW